ncbi:hypothetical protein KSE_37560 [Kitasatospora setae KM-6054]|uniref:GAF domain-containing protein n=1 Tax=Kitasatospora setae (strain ATCC 33774 / DSM 43861 / JCM 3304 / KCC A-0304 / NBRC 14216 / KM-6054) TaxID=452652 RepID=E4NEC4_KITSK|nr:hypothetical protein KSE_37560 [Kitasatospora setae KM-6054]
MRGIYYEWDGSSVFTLVSQWPASAVSAINGGMPAYAVLELVAKDGQVLVRKNTVSPFNWTSPSTPDERVAAVQVKVNNKVIGILAMDGKMSKSAQDPGFAARDVRELLLYADVLAAAIGAN